METNNSPPCGSNLKPRVFKFREFSSLEFACDYFHDRRLATFAFAQNIQHDPVVFYDEMIRHGYRRQGSLLYQTRCRCCLSCVQGRVDVHRFRRSRTQQKIWNRNQDLTQSVIPAASAMSEEAYRLYTHYEAIRHPGSPMVRFGEKEFEEALLFSNVDTFAVEYRMKGRLVLVSLMDVLPHGISAVYTFYSPEEARRSLGTFSILNEIEFTKKLGAEARLYLGAWQARNPGMSYKSQFRPFEVYWEGKWQPLDECQEAIFDAADKADRLFKTTVPNPLK